MFCEKCGKEMHNEAVVCVGCGAAVNGVGSNVQQDPNDSSSIGLNILSFLFPIVGLILYLVYSKTAPLRAKGAGKFALIGVGVSVAGWVLMMLIGIGSMSAYY